MSDEGCTLLQFDPLLTKCICNDPVAKPGDILGYQGLGCQHTNFGGHDSIGYNS